MGFKYLIEDKNIILNLGYSHIIKYKLHKDVNIEYINNLEFVLYSHDKQLLGKTVSEIKLLKKIDAYKGKGIRSEDDIIKLKESKKNK
ncbi:50S ribosomal protein L6 [Candidatus Nardonella dryophthoridicola]|uniref:50S ribosomal protein L6 n=1 Tax=Candidatus Nardonella dryophthoridicola TaxID=1971485 RepID=UPI003B97CAEC